MSILVLGTFAGSVGSLVGMGGSFVALPFLVSYFRIAPHVAHGSSIVTVLATSLGGTAAYALRDEDVFKKLKELNFNQIPPRIGDVDVMTAGSLALGSSITVILGARISKAMTGRGLRYAMALSLLSMAPLVPAREYIKEYVAQRNGTAVLTTDESLQGKITRPAIIGAFTGIISGVLGVGGGAYTVPALSLLTDLSYPAAVGTSLAAMIPTAFVGTLAHARQGTISPRVAVPLGIGSFVGSFAAGTYGKKISDKNLQYVFSTVVGVVGLQAFLQALRYAR